MFPLVSPWQSQLDEPQKKKPSFVLGTVRFPTFRSSSQSAFSYPSFCRTKTDEMIHSTTYRIISFVPNQYLSIRPAHATSKLYSYTPRKNIKLPLIDFSALYHDTIASTRQINTDKKEEQTIRLPPIPPLPCTAHLPLELCTLSTQILYLTAPIHKMMIHEIVDSSPMYPDDNSSVPMMFGHIVQQGNNHHNSRHEPRPQVEEIRYDDWTEELVHSKDINSQEFPNTQTKSTGMYDSLIGSIGCAAEIVMMIPSLSTASTIATIKPTNKVTYMPRIRTIDSSFTSDRLNQDNPLDMEAVITRGSFRFIVREIVQSFPYVVGIVDELVDSCNPLIVYDYEITTNMKQETRIQKDSSRQNDNHGNPTNDEMHRNITTVEQLIHRSLNTVKTILDHPLQRKVQTLSPLEQRILQDFAGVPPDTVSDTTLSSIQKDRNLETDAIFQVFTSSLDEIAPTMQEKCYAIAMLGADLTQLYQPPFRRDLIVCTDSTERLRNVLQALEEKVRDLQNSKSVDGTKKQNAVVINQDEKDLKVGEPTLPPWVKNIRKGTIIEYYWNDEYGWCRGRVLENPIKIIDEYIVTVCFDDGEIHRLPFRGDEKVRWRPGR